MKVAPTGGDAVSIVLTCVPIAPCVLGIVIGPILEKNLISTLIKSQGNLVDFINRPIAFVIFMILCLIWVSIIVSWIRPRNRSAPL